MDQDIDNRLTAIFRDMFDDDGLVLRPEMTMEDVEAWDSLSHISLVLAIAKTFAIKLSAADIAGAKNVGELEQLIRGKLAAR